MMSSTIFNINIEDIIRRRKMNIDTFFCLRPTIRQESKANYRKTYQLEKKNVEYL